MTSPRPVTATSSPFNFNLTSHQRHLREGPKDYDEDDSGGVTATVTCMGVLIFVTFQGSMWVLLAIFRSTSLRNAPSTIFVINLMFIGLLASVVLMPLAAIIYAFGREDTDQVLCDVSVIFNICFMMCSMLTLSLISMDRFYSIMFPMHHAAHATTPIYVLVAVIIWTITIVISLLPVFGFMSDWQGFHIHSCMTTRKNSQAFGYLVTSLSFFVPSTVIVTMYSGVFIMARKAAHKVVPHSPSNVFKRSESHASTSRLTPPVVLGSISSKNTNINATSINATPALMSVNAVVSTTCRNSSKANACRPGMQEILDPSFRSGCSNDYTHNGALSKTARQKSVAHPTAKVSPAHTRLEDAYGLPNQTDTSIFSVQTPTPPDIAIAARGGATSLVGEGGRSQRLFPKSCTKQSLSRSLEIVDDLVERDSNNSHDHSNDRKTSETRLPKPRRHGVGFLCSCHSESKPQPSHRAGETSHSTSTTTGYSSATVDKSCCEKTSAELVKGVKISAQTYNRIKPSYAKALRTVMIIVVSFFLCWGTYFGCQLDMLVHDRSLSDDVTGFALWLGFASYAINPILYGCMNRQIREELSLLFRDLLSNLRMCLCCCCWALHGRCVTPDPLDAEGPCACCVPPRTATTHSTGSVEEGEEEMDGPGGESFLQFLQRTQDNNTPVRTSVVKKDRPSSYKRATTFVLNDQPSNGKTVTFFESEKTSNT